MGKWLSVLLGQLKDEPSLETEYDDSPYFTEEYEEHNQRLYKTVEKTVYVPSVDYKKFKPKDFGKHKKSTPEKPVVERRVEKRSSTYGGEASLW